jgi:tetratricopeptide (TPR) repeat protein
MWYRLPKISLLIAGLMVLAAGARAADADGEKTASPLQLYNDGTQKLSDGKLQEAEACLQGAVASQNERIQPPALYNLGEVRFREGAEEFKKGPKSQPTAATAGRALDNGTLAMRAADAALAGEDVQAMVSAYLQGRGSRKELKSAIEAVKKAMETYGGVLTKWQRAAGDFKSSYELAPGEAGAKTNADVVDRNIAKLVDLQQMMAQALGNLAKQRSDLGKKMAQLKQKMPDGDADKLKGKGDDDDEDEDKQAKGPKEGEEEPGPKDGKEMQLTQEEAARLLDMLKLDGNRKLAMGTNDVGKPKDRQGRDW